MPNEYASPKQQRTQRNNLAKIMRLLEVRAREVWPGKLLVICQLDLEMALIKTGKVPENVDLQHFRNHGGENGWSDVPGLVTIGRTEPGVQDVERQARALFGIDITEIEPDANYAVRWPLAEGYIRLRDGTNVAVQSSRHPDQYVEEVRWQICEAELMQALGRGRGGDRTADNPLVVYVMTCVPLPIVADEAMTWDEAQPSLAKVMWARGAVPLSYRDMSVVYPDLFESREAAKKAIQREASAWPGSRNWGQTAIHLYYCISICPQFSSVTYRRSGARGPASRLLYDAERIDPDTLLADKLSATVVT